MLRKPDVLILISKASLLIFLRGGQSAFGFIIVVLMSRGMTEASLSVALFLTSITLNSGLVGVLGFDVPLVKRLSRFDPASAETRSDYSSFSGRFLVSWAIILILGAVVGVMMPEGILWGALGIPFSWFLLWLFLSALQVFQASILLGFHQQTSSVLFMGALSSLIALAAVSWQLFGEGGFNASDLAQAYLLGLCISCVLAQLHIHRLMGWVAPRFGGCVNHGTGWKELANSAANNALAVGSTQLPFWVIAAMGTDYQVVAYGLAFRLILPLAIILLAVRTLVAPVVSRAWHRQQLLESEPKVRQIAALSFSATSGIAFILLGLHDWLFENVFGRPDFATILPLFWLLLSQCLLAFFGQGQLILRLTGEQNLALRLTILFATVQGLLAPSLFWLFGVSGAAASVAIYGLTTAIVSNRFVFHRHRMRIQASFLSRQRKGVAQP